jgi:hypothetical protein
VAGSAGRRIMSPRRPRRLTRRGGDPQLKRFAADTLFIIQAHYQMADQIEESMPATGHERNHSSSSDRRLLPAREHKQEQDLCCLVQFERFVCRGVGNGGAQDG